MSRNQICVFWVAIAAVLAFGFALPSSAQVNAIGQPDGSPMLSCSPAPCVFAPQLVSSGGYTVFSNVVTANPNNPAQMLVATGDSNCASGVSIYSSGDGGASWARACFPPRSGLSAARPLLAYGPGGVAYAGTAGAIHGIIYGLAISSSLDNGKTWSSPTEVSRGPYASGERLEADNSPNSPFLGSLYIVGGLYPHEIAVSHSHDGAKTWTTTVVDRLGGVGLVDYFPSVATAPDGTVYATWLLCKEKGQTTNCGGTIASIMFSKSSDGGDTWSTPAPIGYPRLAPGADIALWGVLPFSGVPVSEIPVLAVDNSNGSNAGKVYVAFYQYGGTYLKVYVINSGDGGQTWSTPVSVSAPRSGDQFNPWVSVSAAGTVGVTWLNGISWTDKYKPYFAVSSDGGATFIGDQPLTNGSSDPAANPNFFGEYRTHVWVDKALYAVWQDNHTGESNFQVALGGVQF